jgi:virginiamycin A acetyltransferase
VTIRQITASESPLPSYHCQGGSHARPRSCRQAPVNVFGNGWEKAAPSPAELPFKSDTIIGNDVWIGYEALIMPGIEVGNGAIVAARAVVASDVAPYTIVGGNPARPIKQRFDPGTVAVLESLAWWDWPVETITRHLELIVSGDVAVLRAVASRTTCE